MSFGEAIKSGFSHYAKFSGRASRPEFWWFILFASIIGVVLNLIDNAIGWGIILSAIWSLVILLPVLGLYFRRLHDTDRSAWWLLLMLIPFIGTIVLIVFWASKGTADTNKFGAPVS
jgi:uncharacterized membrane protein YhaH (DUF805 family)